MSLQRFFTNMAKHAQKMRELGMIPPKRTFPTDNLEILNEEGLCPECGHNEFHPGPSGGMAVNIKCANPKCGQTWWFGSPFTPQKIEDSGCYNMAVKGCIDVM